jgi:hypothetical protein
MRPQTSRCLTQMGTKPRNRLAKVTTTLENPVSKLAVKLLVALVLLLFAATCAH